MFAEDTKTQTNAEKPLFTSNHAPSLTDVRLELSKYDIYTVKYLYIV